MGPDPEPPEVPALLPTDAGADLNTTMVAGVVAHGAAAVHGRHGPSHSHCENCGTKLEGPFCHRCGQHDFEFHRSFGHVLLEALESFFHFEGKFFRNIVTLLFWPGRLTAEFNAGKRAAQMPPFRLYVFVSVLFFFLFFVGGSTHRAPLQPDDSETSAWSEVDRGHILKTAIGLATEEARQDAEKQLKVRELEQELASLRSEPSGPTTVAPRERLLVDAGGNSAFESWLKTTLRQLADPAFRAKLGDAFIHSIPRLLLFCLPLFALYTRLLFRRSGLVYLQHLVLALHFHAFVYLWILFRDGWAFLANFASPTLANLVWQACMLWAAAYPLLMFRTLFGNSWGRTVWKTLLLSAAYLATLGCGFLVALVLVLVTL